MDTRTSKEIAEETAHAFARLFRMLDNGIRLARARIAAIDARYSPEATVALRQAEAGYAALGDPDA